MTITFRLRAMPSRPRSHRRTAFAAIAFAGLACTGTSNAESAAASMPASAPRGASPITIVAPGPSAPVQAPSPAADIVLQPFPNAIDVGHTASAIEQGTLPISPPDRGLDSDDRVSRVGLPYRGRARLLQYRHGPDESLLLIERHYVEQLKAQGFAVLAVCEAPCRTASDHEDESFWWAREFDPAHQLGTRAYGDHGAYVIGYRRDAIVAVRIGTWELNFGSAIKIIQAVSPDGFDLGALERYAQGKRAKTADAGAAPKAAPRGVQVVPPGAAADAVAHGSGVVVVQLTALDKGCPTCAKASAAFDALSADAANTRFLRVAYASRSAVGGDAFARSQGVASVPFFLTFKDGAVVRRQGGVADAATLRAKLLDGVN